jgi:hypothetical protein
LPSDSSEKISHFFITALLAVLAIIVSNPVLAHCDSYDEPVITDAKKRWKEIM